MSNIRLRSPSLWFAPVFLTPSFLGDSPCQNRAVPNRQSLLGLNRPGAVVSPGAEDPKVKVALITCEVSPFAKTGGLADVCAALPKALAELGHEVVIFMPAFRSALQGPVPLEPVPLELEVPIANQAVRGSLLRATLPESSVPVYLVRQDHYYDRPGLYQQDGVDYQDNCERFVFFCRAVMEALRRLPLEVDILHANDWQTALVPAYLEIEYRGVPGFEKLGSVFTIHNLAYQGRFWHWDMVLTGLDWKYFNWQQMEYYGQLNLMKTGIVFANTITTVSPRYAQEIQSEPLGCGLSGVLRHRREVLFGILNGVDYRVWNPATDPHLPAHYDAENLSGKKECKRALQRELGLTPGELPLVGMIGRLTEQKGFDLAAQVIPHWAQSGRVQWAILGTGEAKYEQLLAQLAQRFPGQVAVRLEFSEALAHRIEAGADIFLMPSRFEPSGLNQLYSLRYGTIPVVHATGGLADTITEATPQTLADGTGNGFRFEEYSARALTAALERALGWYRDRASWTQLMKNAMRQDWSWRRSAREYQRVYQDTLTRVRRNLQHLSAGSS